MPSRSLTDAASEAQADETNQGLGGFKDPKDGDKDGEGGVDDADEAADE